MLSGIKFFKNKDLKGGLALPSTRTSKIYYSKYGEMVVVIKTPIGADAILQVEQEASIMKLLSHPNVLKLEGILPAKPYCPSLVLECAPGGTLLGLLKERSSQSLGPDTAVYIPLIHGLLTGMTYLHSQGVIHRDIKLENILLGQNQCIKIADFGLALLLPPGDTGCLGKSAGSPLWMSPEALTQVPEKGLCFYTPKADMWAIGLLLWAMYHVETPHDPWWREQNLRTSDPNALACIIRHILYDPCAEPDKITDNCVRVLYLNLMSKDIAGRPSAQDALDFFEEVHIDRYHDCDEVMSQSSEGHEETMKSHGAFKNK